MKTSRPSRSDSMYSLPVCGRVTFTRPTVSGFLANSTCPLARAVFAAFAIGLLPLNRVFEMRTDVRNSNETLRAHRGEHKRGSAGRMAPAPIIRFPKSLRHVRRDPAQLRQKKIAHFVAGGAGRMRRHIDRAD